MSTTVQVRLAPGLREHADGAVLTVEVRKEPATVRDLLDELGRAQPAVGRRVRDEQGQVRRHVNVFVGEDNIRDLDGQDTALTAAAEVSILAAVSGG